MSVSTPPPPSASSAGSAKRIAHSTGVLALTTGVSRILGFVRDLLIARTFGTLAAAQAFVVAFRLPNLMRDLVAEGAVSSAFIPVLSWYRAKGKADDYWRLSQVLLSRMVVMLAIITLVGTLGAPLIVRLIAPGFSADPEKLQLAVRLTHILFPLIFLVGLWAYFTGVLNSLRHFAMPALGPAIMNLAMIVACLWFVPRVKPGIVALAIGVMVGGVIQVLIQVPVAMRLGFRLRWRWRHPGSREVMRLLGPRTVGSAVYQLSVMVDTALASLSGIVGDGAVAALYYANRLVQLPLAVFGTATAQASLPALSEHAAHDDLVSFHRTLLAVLRMVGFVIMPASVGLAVLAMPIVGGLFERGAFDHRATLMTSYALIAYSVGLLGFSVNKVLTGAFYALRETRIPVRLAIEAVVANMILSVLLMFPMKIAGLALATSITNLFNANRLLRHMERRLGTPLLARLAGPFVRILLASLMMGAGCWLVWTVADFAARPVLGLTITILVAFVLYGIACTVTQVHELSKVLRWLGRLPLFQIFGNE